MEATASFKPPFLAVRLHGLTGKRGPSGGCTSNRQTLPVFGSPQVCPPSTAQTATWCLTSPLPACWRGCVSSTMGWWWKPKASGSTTSDRTSRSSSRDRCAPCLLTCGPPSLSITSLDCTTSDASVFFASFQILRGNQELLTEMLDPQNFIDNKYGRSGF